MGITDILAENIKKIRESIGLSQKVVADSLGITQGMLSKYESGRIRPSYEVLLKFADEFGVTVDSLLRYDIMIYGNGIDDLPDEGKALVLEMIRRYHQQE